MAVSGRQLWSATKVYAAVKDLPEAGAGAAGAENWPLGVLGLKVNPDLQWRRLPTRGEGVGVDWGSGAGGGCSYVQGRRQMTQGWQGAWVVAAL